MSVFPGSPVYQGALAPRAPSLLFAPSPGSRSLPPGHLASRAPWPPMAPGTPGGDGTALRVRGGTALRVRGGTALAHRGPWNCSAHPPHRDQNCRFPTTKHTSTNSKMPHQRALGTVPRHQKEKKELFRAPLGTVPRHHHRIVPRHPAREPPGNQLTSPGHQAPAQGDKHFSGPTAASQTAPPGQQP